MRRRALLVATAMWLPMLVSSCSALESLSSGDPTELEIALVQETPSQLRSRFEAGANPDEVRNKISLLTRAIGMGRPEVVKVVLDAGATVWGDSRDGMGFAELEYLPLDAGLAITRLLLDAGYSPCASVAVNKFPSEILDKVGDVPSAEKNDLLTRLRRVESSCD